MSEDDLPSSRVIRLQTDDIIVVRSGAYTGDSALVTQEWVGAIAGYDMVARVFRYAIPEFISLALLSVYVLDMQIEPSRLRAAQPHLNAEELGNIIFALPPESEQYEFVHYIKEQEFNKLCIWPWHVIPRSVSDEESPSCGPCRGGVIGDSSLRSE